MTYLPEKRDTGEPITVITTITTTITSPHSCNTHISLIFSRSSFCVASLRPKHIKGHGSKDLHAGAQQEAVQGRAG
ncbi:hypothetical protein E2C01_070666 [Portunus trituberculatus]|uniref:Uncharacterized protein n=1 Tax=Portunus trituberculatus TaxID=210409 RepID=A0A5B7I2X0_PORTR|nr:hypothetical protein [Portunus trituberculatus]